MKFINKKVLITGASRGIGEETARMFATEGAQIIAIARDETLLKQLVANLDNQQAGHIYFRCNLASVEEIETISNIIISETGGIDILINNAGIAWQKPLLDCTEYEWDQMLDINLKSVLFLSQKFVPAMKAQKWGKIINISSLASFVASPGMGIYAASKAAMNQLTRTMAVEWGEYNIQVNAICPTFIMTDMAKDIWEKAGDDTLKEEFLKKIPAGRFGLPADVAKLVLYLSGDDSNYVNGTSIPLDGGKLAKA